MCIILMKMAYTVSATAIIYHFIGILGPIIVEKEMQ